MAYLNKKTLYRLMGLDFSSNQTQTLDGFLSKVSPTSDAALLIQEWKKGGISGNTTIRSLLGNRGNYGILDGSIRTINSLFRVENHNSVNNTFNDFVEPKVGVDGVFIDGEYSQTQEGTGEIIGGIGVEIQVEPRPLEDASIGTYTVSPTGGSGEGAQFELEVIEIPRGGLVFDIDTSAILNGGSGYQEGDELFIPSAAIGGITAGAVRFTLNKGAVSVTTTSTLTIDGGNITISTPTLNVTGAIMVTGSLQTNSVSSTDISGESLTVGNIFGFGVSLFIGDAGLQLNNLPTTDPEFPGLVWNDEGTLKISSVSVVFPGPGPE